MFNHKMYRFSICLLLFCVSLVFSSVGKAEANTLNNIIVKDGKITSDSSLQNVIDVYFNDRSNDFVQDSNYNLLYNDELIDENLLLDKKNRKNAIINM